MRLSCTLEKKKKKGKIEMELLNIVVQLNVLYILAARSSKTSISKKKKNLRKCQNTMGTPHTCMHIPK